MKRSGSFSGSVGDWTVEVVGYNPNADTAIAHENKFNEKPKNGSQYLRVTLRTTYTGSGSSSP